MSGLERGVRRCKTFLELLLLLPETFDFALNTLNLCSFCGGCCFGPLGSCKRFLSLFLRGSSGLGRLLGLALAALNFKRGFGTSVIRGLDVLARLGLDERDLVGGGALDRGKD